MLFMVFQLNLSECTVMLMFWKIQMHKMSNVLFSFEKVQQTWSCNRPSDILSMYSWSILQWKAKCDGPRLFFLSVHLGSVRQEPDCKQECVQSRLSAVSKTALSVILSSESTVFGLWKLPAVGLYRITEWIFFIIIIFLFLLLVYKIYLLPCHTILHNCFYWG